VEKKGIFIYSFSFTLVVKNIKGHMHIADYKKLWLRVTVGIKTENISIPEKQKRKI
jgi:hypothetical protein